ncbi:hypothetical protein H4Q26_009092 [Puccinia striiformis f. sp. tritici PST-130]|nr:hypothetical protein H4Q26_009092 [Puccinia striiformis f. sp. tritici PST-130]
MARGKVQKAGKRASRAEPQNLRPDSGKFDVRKSSIKQLTDWDQEEAQDKQDDFFDGLDKFHYNSLVGMLDSKTTWRFPNSSEIWMTVKKMMMMTKGTSTGEETQSESTNSDNDAEQDEEGVDLVEIDSNELELGTAKLGDIMMVLLMRMNQLGILPSIAEEEERRILELEEVKRLQAKARSKLISSDFCSYLDYASEDEIIDTKVTKKLNQDRVDSSLSALVNDFDSEPEAVAYLLKLLQYGYMGLNPNHTCT